MNLHLSFSPPPNWNAIIGALPGAHILQTSQWASVKAKFGWQPIFATWETAGAIAAASLVLQRTIPVAGFAARMRIIYLPKGPLLNWNDPSARCQVLEDLHCLTRRQGGIFVKIDPDVVIGTGVPGHPQAQEDPNGLQTVANLRERGWRFSNEQIQFRNTILLDLSPDEETLLAKMKQKTRYNIRLAMRQGVRVRIGAAADFPMLYRMYAETSLRDSFVIRDEPYYRHVWQTFLPNPQHASNPLEPVAEPLIAEVEGQAVAALILFRFAGKAWYLYGMSGQEHRQKMPNYLLQWEAIRRAKATGCRVYDLWGAPDHFDEHDPLWGVYRFKEGLGGQVVRHIGAWDLPVQPLLYRLYTQTLPRLLHVMRRRGFQKTRQNIL